MSTIEAIKAGRLFEHPAANSFPLQPNLEAMQAVPPSLTDIPSEQDASIRPAAGIIEEEQPEEAAPGGTTPERFLVTQAMLPGESDSEPEVPAADAGDGESGRNGGDDGRDYGGGGDQSGDSGDDEPQDNGKGGNGDDPLEGDPDLSRYLELDAEAGQQADPEPAQVEEGRTLEEAPPYTFTGDAAAVPEIGIALQEALYAAPLPLDLPEVTDQYRESIIDTHKAIIEFGQDLGLGLIERLRNANFVHVHPASQTEEFQAALGLPPSGTGAMLVSGHRYVLEGSSPFETLTRVTHEAVHAASYTGIDPRVTHEADGIHASIAQGTVYNGYANLMDGHLLGLQEGLISLTTAELVLRYWPQEAMLRQFKGSDFNPGYGSAPLVVDHLISQAEDPDELYKSLQRGMITGERDALQELAAIIGDKGMEALAAMDPTSEASINRAARILGCAHVIPKDGVVMATDLLHWLAPQ
jgi:hypothetical protein